MPPKRKPVKNAPESVFSRRLSKRPPTVPPAGNDQLYTIRQPLRDPYLGFDELVGAAEVTSIIRVGMMQFQATGDTGVELNSSQPLVAEAMARDINTAQPANGPSFLLNLGPGKHDGEVRVSADARSLSAFLENFVQPLGQQPPMATSFGVKMPNQPGVYFHLDAPFDQPAGRTRLVLRPGGSGEGATGVV